MRTLTALVAATCTLGATAAPTPAPVQAEIDALLGRLETSGCEVQRNGTWHAAGQARAHLDRKLRAAEKRTTLHSTERFIELVASSSTVSGKPYLLRCRGNAAEPSKDWLTRELAALRATVAPPPSR